jgi:hypothetical protein
MPTDETWTIRAIVTHQDEAYHVFFAETWTNRLGSVSSYCWYTTDGIFDQQHDAQQYADWLVRCNDRDARLETHPDTRIGGGNYQGCWNAPIVYRTEKLHEANPWN